jgi:hypothetical protein
MRPCLALTWLYDYSAAKSPMIRRIWAGRAQLVKHEACLGHGYRSPSICSAPGGGHGGDQEMVYAIQRYSACSSLQGPDRHESF